MKIMGSTTGERCDEVVGTPIYRLQVVVRDLDLKEISGAKIAEYLGIAPVV